MLMLICCAPWVQESGQVVGYVEDAFSDTSVPEGGEMFGGEGLQWHQAAFASLQLLA